MAKGLVLNDRISEILGHKHARSSILSSASLTLVCLFYVYTVGTFLQIRIYPLIDRVTHYTQFDYYIASEYVDHVIIAALLILWLACSVKKIKVSYIAIGALAALFATAAITNNDLMLDTIALSALPAMITLLLYSRYSRQILNNESRLWMNYLAIIGVAIGLISFAIAVSTVATDNTAGYPIERNYAYGAFLLFSSTSPILLLLLITCFPAKLLIDFAASKFRKLQDLDTKDIVISARVKVIYISLFVLLSIIIAIIPHLDTVNPENQLVGVDTHYYVDWINALNNSTSAQEFMYQAFVQQRGGDRPVSLIFIYVLHQFTDADLSDVIEFTPLILGPALVLAVYFLTRELTSNSVTSLFAAFLTAVSSQLLIGIYAGFYANWLSLTIGYLSFVFLFRFLKRSSKMNLALFSVLLVLTLFAHIYTWSILAIIASIFLLSMVKLNYYGKRNIGLLLIAIIATVLIDLARVSFTNSSGGIEEDLALAEHLAGPEQFVLRWNNLTYTITTFVGGLFANFIMLSLGLYWLLKMKMKEPINVFIIIFLSIGILPFLFGEWVIQTRVLYNIPFQVPAAIALYRISRSVRLEGLLKTATISLWLIVVAFIAVSNFYLLL